MTGSFPRIPLFGVFLFLAGVAFIKASFWLFDDPTPPRWARLYGWGAGIVGAAAIFQGTISILNTLQP